MKTVVLRHVGRNALPCLSRQRRYNCRAIAGFERAYIVQGQAPQISVSRRQGSCLQRVSADALDRAEIYVYEFPLTTSESEFSTCEELLSADERTRAAKFHFQRDSRKFVAARATMRLILGEYVHKAASDLRFRYTKHGKPSLADTDADICFNLSHAGERGILGITRGRDIGVDIENTGRKTEIDNLAKRFFSPAESKSLEGLPIEEKKNSFFRIWTCKEAFLKAQGLGLTRSLGSFDIDLSSGAARLLATRPDATEAARWSILELEASAGYAAAVAVEGPIQRVNLIRYE